MKLADISSGPEWAPGIGGFILLILSGVLISGHGSMLIAGYNTASKKEKEKYDDMLR